jgi:O-antigen/teichoic acid export membrane protein
MTEASSEEDHRAGSRRDLVTSARNALKLGGSLLATWSVALVVRFHLPRHLGPAAFGTFNFAESFAAAFSIFMGLGIETYIQKEVSVRPAHASEFFGGLIVLRALMSCVLLSLMTSVLIATHRPIETVYVALAFGVAQFVIGLNATLGTMLQASTKVGGLAVTTVIAKLLWGAGVVVGIWLHASLLVLALPVLASELLRTMFLFPAAKRIVGLELRFQPAVVKQVIIASLPFYVSNVAVSLGSRLDVSMLEFMSSSNEVGWYSAANNLAGLAMLLAPLLGWVIMPLLSRAARRSREEVFAIIRRAIEALVVVSIPVTLLIGLGASVWVRLVFGPAFEPAATSLRVLAPIFVLTYVAMLLATVLVILERSWTLTLTSLGGLATLPLLVWILVPIMKRLGPGGAGTGAALAQIAMEALIVTSFLIHIGRSAFDRRSLVAIGKSLGVSAVVIALHRATESLGVARLALDAAAYVVLAFAVRAVRFREVANGIRALRSERRAAKKDDA